MITATTFTPVGLQFDEQPHRYTLHGQPCISVTEAERVAGLVDLAFYDAASRERGGRVHAAIERHARGGPLLLDDDCDADCAPYLRAYQRFHGETAFRVDACEERLADPHLLVAGTLDLRGEFVEPTRASDGTRIDIVDVKTGSTPPWVGYQLAGYVRLLPVAVRPRCRRWCLTLRADGTYRLTQHAKRSDEDVFLAAVTIAQAKRGWL